MDLRRHRRTSAKRRIRGHPQRRRRPLQSNEQTIPGFRQEDPKQGHQLPIDGEHPTVPSGR